MKCTYWFYLIQFLLCFSLFGGTLRTHNVKIDSSLIINNIQSQSTLDTIFGISSGSRLVKACPFPTTNLSLHDESTTGNLLLSAVGDSLWGGLFKDYRNGILELYGAYYPSQIYLHDTIIGTPGDYFGSIVDNEPTGCNIKIINSKFRGFYYFPTTGYHYDVVGRFGVLNKFWNGGESWTRHSYVGFEVPWCSWLAASWGYNKAIYVDDSTGRLHLNEKHFGWNDIVKDTCAAIMHGSLNVEKALDIDSVPFLSTDTTLVIKPNGFVGKKIIPSITRNIDTLFITFGDTTIFTVGTIWHKKFAIDSVVVNGHPDSVIFSHYGIVDSGTTITVTINNQEDYQCTVSGDTSGVLDGFEDLVDANKSYTFTFEDTSSSGDITFVSLNDTVGSSSPVEEIDIVLSPVISGNSLLLDIYSYDWDYNDDECPPHTVSDNLGNNWEFIDSVCDGISSTGSISRWRVKKTVAGACTCNVLFEDPRTYFCLVIAQYSGIDTNTLYIDSKHSMSWTTAQNTITTKTASEEGALTYSSIQLIGTIPFLAGSGFDLKYDTIYEEAVSYYIEDTISVSNDSIVCQWVNDADPTVLWQAISTSFKKSN